MNQSNQISSQFTNCIVVQGILLSSGASQPIHMRGPYDVANFALLFALPENKAKAAVFKNGLLALQHGRDRRNPADMAIKIDEPLGEQEEWLRTELNMDVVKTDTSADGEPVKKKKKIKG